MALMTVQEQSLVRLADAIRDKAGVSEKILFPDGFLNTVDSIQIGTTIQTCTVTIYSRDLDSSNSILSGYAATQYIDNQIKPIYIIPAETAITSPQIIENVMCGSLFIVTTTGFPDGMVSSVNGGNTKILGVNESLGLVLVEISNTPTDVTLSLNDRD